jgi:hypothetical protein
MCNTRTQGEIENSIAALRDVPWDSYTMPYGWGQQGLWSKLPDGTHFHTLARSASKKFQVTGDNYGRVRLYVVGWFGWWRGRV